MPADSDLFRKLITLKDENTKLLIVLYEQIIDQLNDCTDFEQQVEKLIAAQENSKKQLDKIIQIKDIESITNEKGGQTVLLFLSLSPLSLKKREGKGDMQMVEKHL